MRYAGTCKIKKDGRLLTVAEGAVTVHPGTPKREAVLGQGGPVGFKETPTTPYIEAPGLVGPDTDIEDIVGMSDGTVIVEFANGKVFVLASAWYAGDPEISSEGELKLRFEGLRGDFA